MKKSICLLILLSLSAQGLATKNSSVRIVKQGMEHSRTGDGNAYGINSYTRYRIDRNDETGLWKARRAYDDVQSFQTLDVDGDGQTSDDRIAGHLLDLNKNNPMTPVAPWYDTSVGSQRFYGAATLVQADVPDQYNIIFSEDGMNDSEEGAVYQPRRNWTFFHETYEIFSPYRIYFLALWQKHDFINGGAENRVSFDENSELRHLVMRYNMGVEGFRWVVRNGDTFYISEATYEGADDDPTKVGGKIHRINPLSTRWAEYHPDGLQIWFDAEHANFKKRDFNDVSAVGWLMYKDQLTSGYVGYKWYAFEADAVVDRPATPSQHVSMSEISNSGQPPFYMSTTEISYELWRKIHRLTRANVFAGTRGYSYEHYGDMGSMHFPDTKGNYLPHSEQEPVTDITFYDALAWCNALSEQESLEPCYYIDPEFTEPFREAVRSPIWGDNGHKPPIYIKWAADGYRLPTPDEWHAAATQSTPSPRGETTLAVNSGPADKNGFHYLYGNVWELVWTQGDGIPADGLTKITVLGGDFRNTDQSASAYGDRPFNGNGNIGLRPVRRPAGSPAPTLSTKADNTPTWIITPDTVTKANPAQQPHTELPMLHPAGENFSLGQTEVTFKQWMPVHDWAVAHGYQFDDNGDMGSMAYWGFGENGQVKKHMPDEPVTGISKYDAMLWLNALSELEGLRPVYYLDKEFTQPVKTSFIYRPLQLLIGEGQQLRREGKLPLYGDQSNAWQDWHADPSANGYRLPELEEYERLVMKNDAYPLQDATLLRKAWLADNSGFDAHPVAQKTPDENGFYDLVGNVSELCNSGNTHKSSRNRPVGYTPQFGGSFIDILDGKFPEMAAIPVAMGLAWPDIGFRALRQIPAPKKMPLKSVERSDKPTPPRQSLNLIDLFIPAALGEETAGGFNPLQGQVHRGNLYRTGIHRTTGVPEKTGIKWSFQTGGPLRSSPVEVDGTVYVGSYDGFVYAIRATDGALLWTFKAEGKVSGSAAVANGTVYIASEAGKLYALDTGTGAERWNVDLNGTCAGSPAIVNGKVVIGQGARYGGSEILIMSAAPLVAFDAETGKKAWQGSPGPQGYAAIATDGGKLYSGFSGSFFSAYNAENGKAGPVWNAGHQARQFMSVTVDGDRLYIPATMRGSVLCTDLNGKTVWHTATLDHNLKHEMNAGGLFGYEIFTDLAVSDATIYAGCNDGKLYTFDKNTGEKGWIYQTDGKVQSSPSIANGIIYFGSWDGSLYALDAQNGQLKWKQPLGDRIISSPWPSDRAIYVGCDNGAIYCIE